MTTDRMIYIPKGSTLVDSNGTDAAVYIWSNANGRPCARAFHGKANKPDWSFYFRTTEQRDSRIADFIESRRSHAEEVKKRRQERKQPHELKIGDILVCSWGYDQTNIDYYKIVKTTARTAEIVSIGKKIVEASQGYDHVAADPERELSKPSRHVVNNNSVRINSFSWAYPWNGNPKYETNYAYGH